jgi:hypothetical protein
MILKQPQALIDMKSLFTNHPNSVNETYAQHLVMSASFGMAMLCGAFAALVHAVLPFLFEKTGSTIITRLHDRMVTNRVHQPAENLYPAGQTAAE